MTTKIFKFSNGDEVKEKISGFKGIITGSVFYLTGCNQYLVTAKPKDEFSEPTSLWYDEGRLDLINKEIHKEEDVIAEENGSDVCPPFGKRGF